MVAWLVKLNSWPMSLRLMITGAVITSAALIQLPVAIEVPGEPFLLCYIASACCALAFGRVNGFLAIAISSVLSFLFFEPYRSLRIQYAGDLIAIEAYAVIGAISVSALARMVASIIAEQETASLAKQHEEHSRLMLNEMTHRVANNFQAAASLIRLRASDVRDSGAKTALDETVEQILIFARLHRQLCNNVDGTITLDSTRFLREIFEAIKNSQGMRSDIRLEQKVQNVDLTFAEALPLGLIVNELVTNSMKYAFPNSRPGSITLTLTVSGSECQLCVSDDGVGLRNGDFGSGRGLVLVRELTNQLRGEFEIHSSSKGTEAKIKFHAVKRPKLQTLVA
ncbi:histidine kinase dimerization/phosphoacceptor domain -containing protein [Rhodomicrobium lacus]|uniref:histidine kinase dimerization/phosphoacceptor domain -containing protein n=1 Tax=Rhodomicrobium lacus TaxID=2498452 RepID=UPI000F8ED981|nr:histidine kinase dimerization/phosphoacceptor domain -containing protein [Rhodomicrobium lacus]